MNKEKYTISYAQNREDIILSAFFLNQQNGFYVDVGANDPDEDSVTKYFYERGWTGVNIEPSPRLFEKLTNARPKDINVNIGISSNDGELEFREYEGHGLSTFSENRKNELQTVTDSNVKNFKDYKVKVTTLKKVLSSQGVTKIDFMKIDVEGYEYEVIKGNDWDKFRPRVLCIEANHINNDWSKILLGAKYEKVYNDGLNDYYVDTKVIPKIEFDYLNAAVGRHVIPSFAVSHIDDVTSLMSDVDSALKQVQKLELENQLMREKTVPLIYENEELRNKLNDQKRLRNQIKSLLRAIDTIITVHIDKLNTYKKSNDSEGLDQSLSELSAAQTLDVIREYDVDNFYNQKLGVAVRDRKAYTIVNGIYVFIKRLIRKILLFVWMGVKRLKKAIR